MMTRIFPAPQGGFSSGMDRILEDMLDSLVQRAPEKQRATIPLNIYEVDRSYRMDFALPGVNIDDLEIMVNANVLTISGKWGQVSSEGIQWHRQERPQGDFARSIELPENIDSSKIDATIKNGILTLSVPKAEKDLPRKIEIKKAD